MPKMVHAIFEETEISIEDALKARDSAKLARLGTPEFYCPECKQRVYAHASSSGKSSQQAAHFEHHHRQKSCSLSDPLRP